MDSARRGLAALAGLALLTVAIVASAFPAANVDGWREDQLATLSSLRLSQLGPPPADPSNRHESSAAAIRLGQRIFADRRFSSNGAVSCASCHQPERQFQDGRALGLGVGAGARRTMPLAGAGYSPFLFWDGRKDSLWSQALGPLEDPAEHGGNRLAYVRLLKSHYRADYEAEFGVLPALAGLPPDAGPLGTAEQRAAWRSMREEARAAVSQAFANIGKALAAYQKTLRLRPSKIDRYLDGVIGGDAQASQLLTASEKNGLRLFIGKGQCVTCHSGPQLTDHHFHNTGIAARLPGRPDPGRSAALGKVLQDEFNCLGPYSSARAEECEELRFLAADGQGMEGAFKTPGLRNVAQRAPYMHAGQLPSLEDVVRHYAAAPAAAFGHSELKRFPLSEQEVRDLVAFLEALNEADDLRDAQQAGTQHISRRTSVPVVSQEK